VDLHRAATLRPRVRGERGVAGDGDGADDGQSEAVQLFVERARSVVPAFALTERNARAVADICGKLDGIPLAIELAAARVPALAPEQIAARLDDRFRLLGRAPWRTAPARHQTLRAAIDWSHELLSPAEQRVLAQLSVFAGGWTLEAAEAVCGRQEEQPETQPTDVLDVLSGLVDKSLVLAEPGPDGVRHRLRETIRQYATERLAVVPGADAVRERHRDWYETLGQHALASYWWGKDLLAWLERLQREQANFRAALRFSLERGEAEAGLRLAAGAWALWGFRGSWQERKPTASSSAPPTASSSRCSAAVRTRTWGTSTSGCRLPAVQK
jgi:predicted ATPase